MLDQDGPDSRLEKPEPPGPQRLRLRLRRAGWVDQGGKEQNESGQARGSITAGSDGGEDFRRFSIAVMLSWETWLLQRLYRPPGAAPAWADDMVRAHARQIGVCQAGGSCAVLVGSPACCST
jgi:hypothetical protein